MAAPSISYVKFDNFDQVEMASVRLQNEVGQGCLLGMNRDQALKALADLGWHPINDLKAERVVFKFVKFTGGGV